MLEDKDTLLKTSGGKWPDWKISKTELGLHIVLFWSWALPLYGVLWLLSRPFHYLGELAEVVFQAWKSNQITHPEFEELWGSAKGCWDGDYASPVDDPLEEAVKYHTDDAGEDHMIVESYEFSYYYDNGERVLFNGDLYDIYALCEPSYILRDPTGSVMSSVKVTESDLEKIDVKKQR